MEIIRKIFYLNLYSEHYLVTGEQIRPGPTRCCSSGRPFVWEFGYVDILAMIKHPDPDILVGSRYFGRIRLSWLDPVILVGSGNNFGRIQIYCSILDPSYERARTQIRF